MTSVEHEPIFAAPELDRDHENRAALFHVFEATRRAGTHKELVRDTLETVRVTFGWVYASYFRVARRETGEPTLTFALDCGEVPDAFRKQTIRARFRRGEGLAGLAWQRRDFVFVEDVTRTASFPRAETALAGGIRSAFWVPVVHAGDVIGTVEFFSPERMRPGKGRLAALRAIQGILAEALHRAPCHPGGVCQAGAAATNPVPARAP